MRAHLRTCEQATDTDSIGYVYIVSRDSKKDCFKIGFSRYAPSKRVKRHRKCYGDATLIAQTKMIRHARRVEQLVHWDLSNCRRKERCAQCDRVHREWFDISEDMAIQTVSTWGMWIASHSGTGQGGG